MGALDKRIFSGVAIVSALLFVVSAVMLLANGGEVSDDANDIALYIVTVAGILAVVYAAVLVMDRSSFVRTVSGALTAVAGVMFLAAPFAGGSTGVLLAAASIVAAAAIVADMLAHWVSRVYGAMYVSAVLAAVDLAMGALYFVDSPQATYPAIALVAFGVWLALSAYVTGFVRVESEVKVREVKEDKQTNKASKPQAKNTKATKKAKKPERKPEPKPAEVVPEPEPVPEEVPVAPVEEPEGPAEEKPRQKPTPRPVTLPNRPKAEERKPEPKPAEVSSAEPEADPGKQAVAEAPAGAAEKPHEDAPQPVGNADGQKPPAKSMNDFMKKLMSSENANRVKHDVPKETPVPKPEAHPSATVPDVSSAEVVATAEVVPEPEPVPEEVPVAPVEEPEESEPVEEPEVEESLTDVSEAMPADKIPTEEVVVSSEEPEAAPEFVEAGSQSEEDVTEMESEVPVEVRETQVPDTDEAPGEDEVLEDIPEPVQEHDVQVDQDETIGDDSEPEPDWSMVSHDASQATEPESFAETPSAEPEAPGEGEAAVAVEPEGAPVTEGPAEIQAEPEPVPEEVPVAPVEELEGSEPVVSPVVEDVQSGPEPVVGEVELGSTDIKEEGEEVLGEDLYTDYSPEAVVRRAAWNKGLRCRRNYGPYNIPVAFVKGKVAVFVDDGDADTSIDTTLADQGWTVLRYDASTVTDGKAQGDEIAAAVKSNLRSAKAAAKKKSKK